MMTRTRRYLVTPDAGSALVAVLLATVLVTTLALGLLTLSSTETIIAAHFKASQQTLYAADAAVERAVQELRALPAWSDVPSGTSRSTFIDGSLTPMTPYGERLNITTLTADVQSESDAGNRWGANNPRWQPFAYGPLERLVAASLPLPIYVIVWVADDPSETDGNPLVDGNGVILVRAEARGPAGSRRVVTLTLQRAADAVGHVGVRTLAWREIH